MGKGDAGDGDDKTLTKWNGSTKDLDDFDKKISRWCRKQRGAILGDQSWESSLPDIRRLHGTDWNNHCESVWECVDEKDSHMAKGLWEVPSGFWNEDRHTRRSVVGCMMGGVESLVEGSEALEVANLTMEKAWELRHHLLKQFGGAGEDVQARQDRHEAGVPTNPGGIAFPSSTGVPEKLRELESERVALFKLCPAGRRADHEWGKSTALVKIVMRRLRPTPCSECIKALLSEIKLRLEFRATVPVWSATTTTGRMETPPVSEQTTEDWDYRNYHDDWLPTWESLKSKLVSVHEEKQFQTPGGGSSSRKSSLPSMHVRAGSEGSCHQSFPSTFMPGGGVSPKGRCFGRGAFGYRKGDPGCPAGPGDWHDFCPPKFLEKVGKNKKKGINRWHVKSKEK
jgi:hypothetical protein